MKELRDWAGVQVGSDMRPIDEGLPIKKTYYYPKADPEKRRMFNQTIAEVQKAGKPMVYIDESSFVYDMPRTHGYAMKGQRCDAKHDWGLKVERTPLVR